jgi:uncharacterized protein (DUF2336 family)
MTSAAQSAHDLTALAKSRTLADRERLILGIVNLCAQSEPSVLTPQVQALLDPIFLSLINNAERDVRFRLVEKLATADWPPPKLVNLLARDEIEIARPIIASSPVLSESDLVRLLIEATVDHQIEVARRPCVGPAVIEAILGQAEPQVLTALASNDTADIPPDAMRHLVEASRQITGMRSPLARHPRLTIEMAQQLYVWVGDVLRSAIVSRFRVDAEALDAAIAAAVKEAQATSGGTELPNQAPIGSDQEQMERRLVAKLFAAGELRPSYLLRALRDRQLTLFEAALASLGGYSRQAVHMAANAERPEMLALACAGVGVDRGVFGAIVGLVRELNHGRPGGDAESVRRAYDGIRADHSDLTAIAFRKAAG